ncbi:mannose-1-phosphate guanylyltransferase [Acidobacteriota bacterium]
MDFYAVIMAGGVGSRFWPLSREKTPKQFLPIISEKSMLEETVQRLTPLFPESKILTISNAAQAQTIKVLLPNLLEDNILIEPQGKNTAPSLLLATASIYLDNPSAVIAVLPADHLITDSETFLKKLRAGAQLASQSSELITFGIPPTLPATGYGYIQFSQDNPMRVRNEIFYPVQEFKEKPDYKQAVHFLKEGNYFWNSGMFLWQAKTFAQKLEIHSPSMYSYWLKILEALKNKDAVGISDLFAEIPSISIDYALMEKASEVRMCVGNFGWSDVGSWSALSEIWERDDQSNTNKGQHLSFNAHNCIVYNPDRFTALIGVQDIIVVNTGDALLVCHKDSDQQVKNLVDTLKKKNQKELL